MEVNNVNQCLPILSGWIIPSRHVSGNSCSRACTLLSLAPHALAAVCCLTDSDRQFCQFHFKELKQYLEEFPTYIITFEGSVLSELKSKVPWRTHTHKCPIRYSFDNISELALGVGTPCSSTVFHKKKTQQYRIQTL
ncbi:hypothetical protein E2C01_002791 [Portunus trituberculatus]|uniref:Uncharacterized protein n=1 Tax=Portunus trituberculatus TaxID=210409 RepID=A0A5B7CKE3_PORTR|nr:hypothetical protein [Portunus trituberculatus]